MAPNCQTQLKFDLAADAAAADEDTTERFAFRGKTYTARLAPPYGCKLAVSAYRHRAKAREIRDAFHAFKDEHQARVDALYAARFPKDPPPVAISKKDLPF